MKVRVYLIVLTLFTLLTMACGGSSPPADSVNTLEVQPTPTVRFSDRRDAALAARKITPDSSLGGVAVDAAGNIFIADWVDHRILRVDAETGVLTTVAGTGERGFGGDGGAATNAQLDDPVGVTIDSSGNVFVADSNNHRVRRVDAETGIITTVAGTGERGFSGDGSPASSAQLDEPEGVAVDAAGNLFIADWQNHGVRRVDAVTGIISTVAGNGQGGFSGDGASASGAQLNEPEGVAVDHQGNLFIADSNNHRIRRVDAGTGIITTVAGTGESGYNGDGSLATNANLNDPIGVAMDRAGNLFISDWFNHRIRRVDSQTGIISTVAGTGVGGYGGDGGPAASAQLDEPEGVAVDGPGTLFISDWYNHRIRRVDSETGSITTASFGGEDGFIGDGYSAASAQLDDPEGVAVDGAGNLFIADTSSERIRRVSAETGIISTVAGTGGSGFGGDGGLATMAQLNEPEGIAVDAAGNLFIADSGNHRIRRVDAETGIITSLAGTGESGFNGDGNLATSAQLTGPEGVAVDGAGNLFIADTGSHRIRRVDAETGFITTVAGTGVSGYSGDGAPAISAQLDFPEAVAVDGAGNLFIADTGSHRIRRVDAETGIISTVAGTVEGFGGDGDLATSALVDDLEGVAVDGVGNIFITDSHNDRIRRVDAETGIITTVAGTGEIGFSGDGGPATSALLDDPDAVAVDGEGNLFIADSKNGRIRRVDAKTGIITTVAGSDEADLK